VFTTVCDTLEVVLHLEQSGCDLSGTADVNWYDEGTYLGRPVTGTATQDSVFLEVQVQSPQDPDNIRYRLEIVDSATLSGVFGYFADDELTTPVTFTASPTPTRRTSWGDLRTKYVQDK